MNTQPIIEDVNHWVRVDRGRELQFFATDDEVQTWLIEHLPSEYAPYTIVGSDKVKRGRGYVDELFECEVANFLQCLQETTPTRFSFWIWSKAIFPNLPSHQVPPIDALCSYNGLVLLQHGLMIEDRRSPDRRLCQEASRIAISTKFKNLETGEIRENTTHLRIYNVLRKTIKHSLIYSSINWDINGNEFEDELQLWTEGAKQSYERGKLFWCKPGRKLTKNRKI